MMLAQFGTKFAIWFSSDEKNAQIGGK